MSNLSVIILTFNEEKHIARAILSVNEVASRVIVVDSFSTDNTVAIARLHGAEILQNKFISQSHQFQWALDNTSISGGWVMRLDADEVVEPDLQSEIAMKLSALPEGVVGVTLTRKHVWMNRWVRHGGRYPLKLLRIWRAGHGQVEDRWMDEHIVVSGGGIVEFQGGFLDHNLNDISFFTQKHNSYATREALDVLNSRLNLFPRTVTLSKQNATRSAVIKRWLKVNVYNRLPFPLSASAYFLWRIIFQLGILDGKSGIIYHFLQGFWYRFLVGAKVFELEEAIRPLQTKAEIIDELNRLTGFRINS